MPSAFKTQNAREYGALDYAPVVAPKYFHIKNCYCNHSAWGHGAQIVTGNCPNCNERQSADTCQQWPITCRDCESCGRRIEFCNILPNAR